MKSFIFVSLQYLAPQHFLSRVAGWLADSKISWLKALLIRRFAEFYGVDMAEAARPDLASYSCFNDFFCRALKPTARPIADADKGVVSPADGAFSQLGKISRGRIFQAKGRDYSLLELVGGSSKVAEHFTDGNFATIYLAPKDYHRLHMPVDGTLVSMTHIPGSLFSVNPTTTDNVPRLFARNERVCCVFDTSLGPLALVLVGAMIVASIETTWAGLVTPAGKEITTMEYQSQPIQLKRGQEFGRFKLGSTVILLCPRNALHWLEDIHADSPVKMGELIAKHN